MQSKTSWFNKEMAIQSFRNVGWVGIVYLAALLFTLPLRVLMEWSNRENYGLYYEPFRNVFSVMFPIQLFLMFGVPILLAVFLFRFFQVKSASDFMHSLPVKRTSLYSQYVGYGLLYLIVPVLITSISLLIIEGALGADGFFTTGQILYWAGITMVITLLVFLTGALIGTITGLSAVQGVLTIMVLMLPAGVMALIVVNLDFFLHGFVPNYYSEHKLAKLSPITNAATFFPNKEALSILEILIYIAFAVLFYLLGMWFYKKRNLEMVSQAIVFRQLRPVFKYGVTFCAMLFGGIYFGTTQNNINWIVFGYVIGSIVGYLIAEMLLRKTWRVSINLKSYTLYFSVIAVLVLCIHFDITGYQQRIPDIGEVERVYFGNSSYDYMEEVEKAPLPNSYEVHQMDEYKPYFTQPENIQTIQNLHSQLIENENVRPADDRFSQTAFIAYELKNGDKVVRSYEMTDREQYNRYLTKIYSSVEYKEAEYEVLHVEPEQIERISISPSGPVDKIAVIAGDSNIADIVEALKTDILNEETSVGGRYGEGESDISILLKNNQYDHLRMPFKQTYTELEKVLREQNKLEEARINAEEISFAVVVKQAYLDEQQISAYDTDKSRMEQMLDSEQAVKITDQEQLATVWRSTGWNGTKSEYMVGFEFKENGEFTIRELNEENIPDSIKQQLE